LDSEKADLEKRKTNLEKSLKQLDSNNHIDLSIPVTKIVLSSHKGDNSKF
jgi:hypothetical protein